MSLTRTIRRLRKRKEQRKQLSVDPWGTPGISGAAAHKRKKRKREWKPVPLANRIRKT